MLTFCLYAFLYNFFPGASKQFQGFQSQLFLSLSFLISFYPTFSIPLFLNIPTFPSLCFYLYLLYQKIWSASFSFIHKNSFLSLSLFFYYFFFRYRIFAASFRFQVFHLQHFLFSIYYKSCLRRVSISFSLSLSFICILPFPFSIKFYI